MTTQDEPAVTARVTVRAKGQVTLPPAVRDALHVAEGDQVEISVNAHGDVTLRGMRTVPTDQAWFWTPEWQEGEREADDEIRHGLVHRFDSADDFLKSLGG